MPSDVVARLGELERREPVVTSRPPRVTARAESGDRQIRKALFAIHGAELACPRERPPLGPRRDRAARSGSGAARHAVPTHASPPHSPFRPPAPPGAPLRSSTHGTRRTAFVRRLRGLSACRRTGRRVVLRSKVIFRAHNPPKPPPQTCHRPDVTHSAHARTGAVQMNCSTGRECPWRALPPRRAREAARFAWTRRSTCTAGARVDRIASLTCTSSTSVRPAPAPALAREPRVNPQTPSRRHA